MEYRIITAREHEKLEILVQAAIAKGFEPIGGVAIQKMRYPLNDNDERYVLFAQAVLLKV